MGFQHGWSDKARLFDNKRKAENKIYEDMSHKREVEKIENDIIIQQRCDVCGDFYHPDSIENRKCFNCNDQVEDVCNDNEIEK